MPVSPKPARPATTLNHLQREIGEIWAVNTPEGLETLARDWLGEPDRSSVVVFLHGISSTPAGVA
jgi:hypothetical protein